MSRFLWFTVYTQKVGCSKL